MRRSAELGSVDPKYVWSDVEDSGGISRRAHSASNRCSSKQGRSLGNIGAHNSWGVHHRRCNDYNNGNWSRVCDCGEDQNTTWRSVQAEVTSEERSCCWCAAINGCDGGC